LERSLKHGLECIRFDAEKLFQWISPWTRSGTARKIKSHIRERVVQNAAGLIPRGYGLVDRDGCALREKYDQVAAIRHPVQSVGNAS
jgi:hypothetical protein